MRKWGPLVAVCLGTFMLLLDVTIVIVALPDMARVLGASLSDLQWVIDGYALALAALLLGIGAAADRFGRRRVHVAGVVLFAVASLGCGLASSPALLVAARGVQGVGAAAMFATTLPLLASVYRDRERSVALGLWGAVSGGAAAVGPVVGGLLTEGPGWRWIFFVNLPVSVAAIWLTARTVPESRGARDRRIDWAGTVSFAVFAAAATYAVVRAGSLGWTSASTLVTFGIAALALLCFVRVERRVEHPLLELSLFRKSAFTGVMAGAFAYNLAAFAVLPYTSIWLQTVLGLSPVQGGLALLPLAATAFVVAAVGGRLLHGVQPRLTIGVGLVLIGVGTLGQAVLGAGSSWPALLPGLVVAGIGTGLVTPALAGAALASVPPQRAGMAGGAVNTFRQLGYALGVAVLGTVVTSRIGETLGEEQSHGLAGGGAPGLRAAGVPEHALRAAFASGLNTAAVVAGVVGVVAGVAVLLLVRKPPEGREGGAPERVRGGDVHHGGAVRPRDGETTPAA
ncbi:MFS transporter [Streptomyces sp. NPDC005776]|uniref:MFS transporter n=1 Tax=unclassified Streptomyces TaxID=2593676 RepID=UPI0033E56072